MKNWLFITFTILTALSFSGCAQHIDTFTASNAIAQHALTAKRGGELAGNPPQEIRVILTTANAISAGVTVPLAIPVGINASITNTEQVQALFKTDEINNFPSSSDIDKKLDSLQQQKIRYFIRGTFILSALGIGPKKGEIRIFVEQPDKSRESFTETVNERTSISTEPKYVEPTAEQLRQYISISNIKK